MSNEAINDLMNNIMLKRHNVSPTRTNLLISSVEKIESVH